MSTTLTESATWGGSVTVPADGDTRNAASVNAAFQELTNRSKCLKGINDASNGMIVWSGAIRWATASTITVSKIIALVLSSVCLTNSADATVGASKVETTGVFANSTWYYLYAYNNANAIDFQLSTTAPEASRTFKNGTTTHRYLGAIRTDGSGNILPFSKAGNQYRWFPRSGSATHNAFRALDVGNQTTRTAFSIAELAPPHAEIVSLRCLLQDTAAAAPATAGIYRDDANNAEEILSLKLAGQSDMADVECPPNGTVLYYVVSDANIKLTVHVRGWSE